MQNKGYPPEFIEKVKTANNIIDIAKSYMPLKQKGQDFWGCCPFHSEKTPSFKISSQNQFYYCFGCHVSGNVLSLVMKMENLSYREALEHLAKKANLELPKNVDSDEWDKARQKKEKIFQALNIARDYYCKNLYQEKNKNALLYLHNRGIDDSLIKLFNIGYSDSWNGVVDELKKKGITENIAKEAGIAASNEKGHIWDSQFERITFSIHDVYGNCIGFTGRTMSKDDNIAKYKNTAETIVFNKSNIVYGIDVMKEKTRGKRIDGLIVVEGNVDEISMIKNGFFNTVACMGTALTKFHAGIMARFGKNVYLCLDGDSAGENATLKSIDVLKEAGLTVRVISLPDKLDPDDFLKSHSAAEMENLIKNSIGGVEFKLSFVKKHSNLNDNIGKADYLNRAIEILINIESPAERELYLPEVAKAIGIEVEAVRSSVNGKIKQPNKENTIYSSKNINNIHNIQNEAVSPAIFESEKFITSAILHNRPYATTKELPQITNKVFRRIIEEGLKLSNINDKLSEEDLKYIEPLIAKQFDTSNENQILEWQDCIRRLKIEELRQKRENTSDIAEKERIRKEIQSLYTVHKLEEKK